MSQKPKYITIIPARGCYKPTALGYLMQEILRDYRPRFSLKRRFKELYLEEFVLKGISPTASRKNIKRRYK